MSKIDDLIKEANEYTKAKNHEMAFSLYLQAAKLGNAFAQNQVGYAYMYGEGVEKNYEQAVYWLQKGAKQNNKYCLNNLGVCYSNGFGVEKDSKKAFAWYHKAAEQGHADAQRNVANCYENGEGTEKNLEKARKWYRKAAANGSKRAKLWLKEHGEIVDSPEEIHEQKETVPSEVSITAEEELNSLIGLEKVKTDVREMISLVRYQKKRKEQKKIRLGFIKGKKRLAK